MISPDPERLAEDFWVRHSEQFICTKDNPWSKDKSERAQHPDAVCIHDGGWEQEYESYKCPNCGLYFQVTIPG